MCAIFGSFPREFPVLLVVETPFWRCSGNLPPCNCPASLTMLAPRRQGCFSDAISEPNRARPTPTMRSSRAYAPLPGRAKAHPFVDIQVSDKPVSLRYSWRVAKFKEALARDG